MICLKNKNVSDIIEMRLNKLENQFLEEELNAIRELVYDGNIELSEQDDLSDLKYFRNLNSLLIMNFIITKREAKNIFILPNIKNLTFERVKLEYANFLEKMALEKISFINVDVQDFNFISNMQLLNYVEVVNATEIDINIFKKLKELKNLRLSYSKLKNIDVLENFEYLEELDIDNTNILEISFLRKWNFLKKVSLTEEQIKNNKNTVQILKDKDIKIYIENAIEY